MQSRTLNIVIAGMLAIGVVGFPTARCDAEQQQVLDSGAPRRSMDVDSELEHVTKELGLTEVQREQIRPLLVEHQQREQALHQDTSLSPDDLRAKAHAISDDTHKEIDPLLTDQQRRLARAIEKHGHNGATRGGPAASGGG